jgi:hypothetical protein
VKSPLIYGQLRNPANVVAAACLEEPEYAGADCTTATLKTEASALAWLWAQPLLPAYAWHRLVANELIKMRFYPR